MKIFLFAQPGRDPFALFSSYHLLILLAVAAFNIASIYILMRANSSRINLFYKYALAFFILLMEIISNLWKIYSGIWKASSSLPLHLCGIAAYVSIIMLISKNYRLYETAYFWGLCGALIAVITPTLEYNFPHLMFIKFFLAHWAIINAVLYMTFIEGYRPVFKSAIRVFIITNIYMLITAIINYLLDANYLYICRKPKAATLLDIMGPWPVYIIWMEAGAALLFSAACLPFYIIKRKKIIRVPTS